ncbi:hypothetical protein BD626DRAFT_60746, partial [Schizophyllum amplum]
SCRYSLNQVVHQSCPPSSSSHRRLRSPTSRRPTLPLPLSSRTPSTGSSPRPVTMAAFDTAFASNLTATFNDGSYDVASFKQYFTAV